MKRPRCSLSGSRNPAARFSLSARLLVSWSVLVTAGCHRAAPPAEEEGKAPVKVVLARRVSLGEHTELLGSTQPLPQHAARVTAPVEGHVLWALGDGSGPAVVEGQEVEKGRVIVQLDDRIIRANRAKIQALLDEQQELRRQADIALQVATVDLNRLEALPGSERGAIPLVSRVEREKVRLLLQDAEGKQKAALAKERALRADLEVLEVQLEFHKLRAPIAGRLGTVHAVPGQTLAIGTAVADVVDLREIDVVCLVPPENAARLALGQPARVSSGPGSLPEESSPVGRVVFIAVQAQPETGNFLVKVRFPNPELRLRANMVVRCHVLTQPEKERLVVDEKAIVEDEKEPAVVVVQEVKTEKNAEGEEETIGEAHKLHVVLGVRDREKGLAEVLSLEDPEKHEKVSPENLPFVVEGGHGLHDGDVVKVKKEEEKEGKKEGEKDEKKDEKKDRKKDPEMDEKKGEKNEADE
jgi:RND family efflux transporter MFP subunit